MSTVLGARSVCTRAAGCRYTLRWVLEVVRSSYPHGFAIVATGDFDGTGEWTYTPRGADVEVRFDWKINANKPLLQYLSFAFRPMFAANHRWAMRQGEVSLQRELARRHQVPAVEDLGENRKFEWLAGGRRTASRATYLCGEVPKWS